MKALILTLALVVAYESQANETKERREIAGQMVKKKKKESMWARDLRDKLSSQSAYIRTM